MNDSNTEQVVDDINLDDFSKEFFQTETKTETPVKEDPVETEEVEEVDDETSEDDTSLDNEETQDTEDEEEDETPEPPKEEKPKSRFQERISELTNRAKAAEAREAERDAEIARLKALLEGKETKQEEPVKPTAEPEGPTPDDKNADGTDKYPLGEFDPAYVRDLARHAVRVEREALKAAEEQERQVREENQQRQALIDSWAVKLEEKQEALPDFAERNLELQEIFSKADPAYADYIALTVMSMDKGPEVLYHLATNPEEARKLVKMSAAQATLALGKIEARFELQAEEKTKKLKVSNAPKPPERLNKGTHVSREVKDDTDDLDAFSRKFFKSGR